MQTVRVFVSSPGDVDFERLRVDRVAERLNGQYSHFVRFETIRWENRFYSAHRTFQDGIPDAKDCDIVIAIFWSRLGTSLPDSFPHKLDGRPYPSGTAYEVLTAIEARKSANRPDVYVFRKTERPTSHIDTDTELSEAREQWTRLEAFFSRWFRGPDGSFSAAYHQFANTDEFELQIERLLDAWVHDHLVGDKTAAWQIEIKGSPFRGLAPFDARHAAVFFGRDRKVARAVEHLKDAARRSAEAPERTDAAPSERRLKPFLLIVGPSGAGKSSLMRAGLAPRLITPGVVPEVDVWRVAVVRPGAGPFLLLARALLVAGRDDDPGGFGCALPELRADGSAEELAAEIATSAPEDAARLIVAALDRVADDERRTGGFERAVRADLLLLVDQLEDIFAAAVTEEERSHFANLLAALAVTHRVWLVATLRADLYGRLIKNRAFIALKDSGSTYDLAPPGPDELAEIIQKSAEAAHLVYDTDPETGERLDDRLLRDAEGKDILPLLQFTLDRLFNEREVVDGETRLTFASYRAMGGIDGAINQSAERALARLVRSGEDIEDPFQAAIQHDIDTSINPTLERLLRTLAVPASEQQGALAANESALTARVVPLAEAIPDDATSRLVHALLEARIVLTSSGEGSEGEPGSSKGEHSGLIRVAHQRVLECWERAQRIINEHRDFYRIRELVENYRRRWHSEGRGNDLLLPDGRNLEQAEVLISRYGTELPAETHEYVALSGRLARRNRTIRRAMRLSLAVVAVIATFAGLVAVYFGNSAVQNEKKAVANYTAARETVDSLVTGVAERLRDVNGISVRAVDEALSTVRKLVDGLERESGGDPQLKRTRGMMQYQFAQTFQAADDNRRALQEAKIGLTVRDELARLAAVKPDWEWDLALSLDQVGDIERFVGSLKDTRSYYEKAFTLRKRLTRDHPDVTQYTHGLSLSLVRLGDLVIAESRGKPGDGVPRLEDALAAANSNYDEAMNVSIGVFRREPDEVRWQRELSWNFNKVGDVRMQLKRFADALDAYEKGLCTRRYMANRDDKNTLWRRDVAFSLEKVAEAQLAVNNIAAAEEPLFEALVIRRALSESDSGNTRWAREVTGTLRQIAGFQIRQKKYPLAAGFYLAAIDIATRIQQRAPDDRFIKRELDDSTKARAALLARLTPDDPALPSDAVLRAGAQEEESSQTRRVLGRNSNPLECWAPLIETLGVPKVIGKTAQGP